MSTFFLTVWIVFMREVVAALISYSRSLSKTNNKHKTVEQNLKTPATLLGVLAFSHSCLVLVKSPTQKFQSSDPPTHKLFPTFAILKRQTITNLLIYGTLLLAQPELRQQSARGRRGQGRVVGVATLFHGPLVSRLSAQDVRSDHHQDQKGEEGGLSVKARISGPHGNRRTNFKTSGIFCRWIFPPTKM